MSDRSPRDYFNDILESITDIKEFTAGLNLETFTKNKKTINAVVRSLEVIGEAANKIPKNLRQTYPQIPWEEIIGMRNRLTHEYFGIDLTILWQTIEEDIIPLETNVKKMFSDLYKS